MTVTIGRGAQRPSRKCPVTPAPAVIAEIDHLVAWHRAAMMIFAAFVRIEHVDEDQHGLHLRIPWRGSGGALAISGRLSDGRPIRAPQVCLKCDLWVTDSYWLLAQP